jgi:hypothetical protein
MKSIILQTVMLVGFIFCSISFAQAQYAGAYKADIPFDFNVGKKQYSAGTYMIEIRGLGEKYFVIRDVRGRNPYVAMTFPGDASGTPTAKLDFQRVGDQYFLISIRASDLASLFPKPKITENLARTGADGEVTVALSKGK